MAVRRPGERRQRHSVCGNVDQLVAIGVIEMMMMIGVRIEDTMLIVDGDPPQQTGAGELVERVVDGATRHVGSGIANLSGEAFGGHMTVTAVKKQLGNHQTLARWAQPGMAKTLRKSPVTVGVAVIACHVTHHAQKHAV